MGLWGPMGPMEPYGFMGPIGPHGPIGQAGGRLFVFYEGKFDLNGHCPMQFANVKQM